MQLFLVFDRDTKIRALMQIVLLVIKSYNFLGIPKDIKQWQAPKQLYDYL
jgi:hypothetical protein